MFFYLSFGGRECISISLRDFDRSWMFGKLHKCDVAVGVVFVLSLGVSYVFVSLDKFSLYSLTWASRRHLLKTEKIPKKFANPIWAAIGCLLVYSCIAYVL